jgi:uncharacterized protein
MMFHSGKINANFLQMKLRIIALCLIFLTAFSGYAQNFPEKPNPPRIVNDFANTMSADEVAALEQKLVAYNDTTSTQIAIVTIADLEGYDVTDYADRLAEKWGIGQKGTNNGLLILIKPKTSGEKGLARISVGYGLEDVIPDAVARRIVDNEMIPEFAQGSYYKGISKATDVVVALATGKYKAKDYKDKKTGSSGWIVIVFIAIVFILMRVFRGSSGVYHAGGSNLPFWATLFMLGSMGRGSNNGSWNDFSSGGGSFGGGGGGFGGFGGGSFGGGGASGSW